jgi:predicted dehydrogenase
MNVAIVGCGLIGKKRVAALGTHTLRCAVDVSLARAQEVAALGKCERVSTDYRAAFANDIDIVVVATTNEHLAEITLQAVAAGKHVLVEKPAGRNAAELTPIIKAAREKDVRVKVGFNHRYHPALQKARALIDAGAIGDLMFIRGRYGHGGRVGYEKEWRADPQKSGGGELIDQGVHLIDLSRWFLGDFAQVSGFVHTYFWDMPVDDNSFMSLRTARDQVAWLHVSCSEWKNLFSFEIYGRSGKLHIEGLGGSYGVERLAYYQMLPQMGPPVTTIYEYPFGDDSWRLEFDELVCAINERRDPLGSLGDAKQALDIVGQLYRDNQFEMTKNVGHD